MNINLPSVSPPIPGLSTGTEIQKQTAESGGLSRTFEKLLQDVNQQQLNAEAKQIELMVTDNKDIHGHGTMLALEKADLSLRLMLQIRNKLVNAYEEVMRMQV